MNENEFTHEGVEYVAKDAGLGSCEGCAFDGSQRWCAAPANAPHCSNWQRADERSIIWVKKK